MFGTAARSRQMRLLPPVGNDVIEDDESGDVGHLEKVTSRKTTRAATSAIFEKWRILQLPQVTTTR